LKLLFLKEHLAQTRLLEFQPQTQQLCMFLETDYLFLLQRPCFIFKCYISELRYLSHICVPQDTSHKHFFLHFC